MKVANACRNRWLTIGLSLLVSAMAVGNAAADETARCAGTGILVPQWGPVARDRVCAAADAAIDFLRNAGFTYRDGLTIRPFAENRSANYQGHEIGHFDIARNEIAILPLAAAMRAMPTCDAFEVPMRPELWASYVSHEVAHAVAEQHFAAGVRRLTASEYIAGVVQLMTMEPSLRAEILARFSGLSPYRSADEISSLYYLMAPGQFAVKVYRHYIALGSAGPAFLHLLLRNGLRQ
jgi:hypothetical protein